MMRILGRLIVLIFFLSPLLTGACEIAGLSGKDYRIVDQWQEENNVEFCLARTQNYPLVIRVQKDWRSNASMNLEAYLRDYIDQELSEVQSPERQRLWSQKRALIIGSLLDFKRGRLHLKAFRRERRGWRPLKSLESGQLILKAGVYELYFKKRNPEEVLLGDLGE